MPINRKFMVAGISALAINLVAGTQVAAATPPPPQVAPFSADDLGMERHRINFPDSRLWIFNGDQRCQMYRWTTTDLFFPGYRFHFDFVEKRSGIRIVDNVPEIMDRFNDPLGYNFRPGSPFCIVAQDDTWYPHKSIRTGTFHKKFKTGLTSFSIRTATLVARRPGRVYLAVTLTNRSPEPLTLTLLPVQNDMNLIRMPAGNLSVCVSSDLAETSGEGFAWTLPANTTQTRNFYIADFDATHLPSPVNNRDLAAKVGQCEKEGREQISRIASRIPAIKTQSRQLDDFYKRCIASLALCRWNPPEWRSNPTWVCGGFVCVVSWDFSFAADTLSLVDPQSLRRTIRDILGIGRMKGSYISITDPCTWWGTIGNPGGILYLQDPFALKEMTSRYIAITGDASILDDQTGGATVYEWFKRWGDKLHNEFGKGPDGLIDVKENDELLIEIRTSDYNHIVPVVNGLAADYYHWLAKLGARRNDADAAKFARLGDTLQKALQERLWNEKAGWFDNMYADGSRLPLFSNHLFDLLGTTAITAHQRKALDAHIREGEFLADYGMYSISKKDTVHWDRMDADWGGGGSYVGTPLRVARRLYEYGNPQAGWDVLKRMARMADHFCFMPQSPLADEPNEFRDGGNLQISCASGMEAIWSGIFGLRPQDDGSMLVTPAPFNPEVGEAELVGYQFRRHRYDVRLLKTGYDVFVDGKRLCRESYGRSVTVPPQPVIPPPAPAYRISASSFDEWWTPGQAVDGSWNPFSAWISKPFGGGTKTNSLDSWWAIEFLKAPATIKGVKLIGDHRDNIPLLKNLQVQVRDAGAWKTVGEVKNAAARDVTVTFAAPVSPVALRVFVSAADIPSDGYVRICEITAILSDGSETAFDKLVQESQL